MKRRPMVDMDEFERRLRRQSSGNQTDDDPLAEARLTSGQQDSEDCRSAGPEFDRSAAGEASSSEAQETVAQEPDAQEPDALQSSDDDNMACQDSGTVNEEIASRRSLYIMIMAAIIIVGMVGIGASFRYRSGASPPPEIATISENEKTNRPDVPTPDASIFGAAPQPSPGTVVADPLQPRETETMPAAGIAASPEQIETQVEPSSQTAPIAPEKMNTASVEPHDALLYSDMPPRATATFLSPQSPAAVAPPSTPKTAARTPKTAKPSVAAKLNNRSHPEQIVKPPAPKPAASPESDEPSASLKRAQEAVDSLPEVVKNWIGMDAASQP